ncbi:MAG: hypothetical protein VB948_16375, partial [Pseudomonadales bacterium]
SISHNGPMVLVDGDPSTEDLALAARILARYSQGRSEPEVTVRIAKPDGVTTDLSVVPFAGHEIPQDWHVGA